MLGGDEISGEWRKLHRPNIELHGLYSSPAMGQVVACAPVTQRARVRSPVGTSFLGDVFSAFFLTCKTNVGKLQAYKSRMSFSHHNHPFMFALLE